MTGLVFDIASQATPTEAKPVSFCSRCGDLGELPAGPAGLRRRVCGDCGMGMLLTCSSGALPGSAAAFLVCDDELVVRAVSESAEQFFGREADRLGASLLDLVSSPLGADQLARHASMAAQRDCDPLVMPLRLAAEDAPAVGTLTARIATCGPPRAALVSVEPSGFGRA